MAESWIAYMGKVDDENASFLVDLDAGENYDIADYPVRIELSIPFESGQEDGLPDRETLEALNTAEDRCVEAVCRKLDAVHVGHAIRPGRLWTLFYAPAAANLEDAARKLIADLEVREATVEAIDDEDWAAYFDFLFPAPAEFQWLGNRQLVDHLEEQGDSLWAERPVDHAACFTGAAGRDAFADAVAKLGFTVGDRSENRVEGAEELPFGLEFTRTHAVDMETINEITMPLVELAIEHDGVYDGWGTTVVS